MSTISSSSQLTHTTVNGWNDDDVQLNVPHANEVLRREEYETESRSSSEESDLVSRQVEDIEHYVRSLTAENPVVSFELSYPLHKSVVKALFRQGYSVSHSTYYSDNNGEITQKNTATVSLVPAPLHNNHAYRLLRNLDTLFFLPPLVTPLINRLSF